VPSSFANGCRPPSERSMIASRAWPSAIPGADRVDEHAERRDHERVAVHALERIADRCAQVGAAADRLGDEHLGRHVLGQAARRVDQRVEAAAEAPAGDFLHREPARGHHRRVDQPDALVVRDEADAAALSVEILGESQDGGGLPGTEESTNHDVARAER